MVELHLVTSPQVAGDLPHSRGFFGVRERDGSDAEDGVVVFVVGE